MKRHKLRQLLVPRALSCFHAVMLTHFATTPSNPARLAVEAGMLAYQGRIST